MRNILVSASRVIFYGLAIALLFWTSTMTLAFVGAALPNLAAAKYFALAIFDVGAVSWLLIFLFAAQGIPQRATALMLAVIDLLGIGLMVFAELFTGGQTITAIPADIGRIALWGIGFWTLINLVGVFAYHITDPDTMQDIARKNAADKITAKSLKLLDSQTDEIADEVAGIMAGRMVRETLLRLDAPNVTTGGGRSGLTLNGGKRSGEISGVAEVIANPNGRQEGGK